MLEEYASEYVATFNKLQTSLPNSPYSKRLIEARIFHAKDAAVIFFISEDAAKINPNFLPQGRGGFLPLKHGGISVSPENDQPLTVVLQAITYNYLRVGLRTGNSESGFSFGKLKLPPDLPNGQTYCSGSLNPEWLYPSKGEVITTCMAVAPTAEMKDGKIIGELPTRRHIFSPLLTLEDSSVVLQHTWPFLDVLFHPQSLDLSQGQAEKYAKADCLALRIASNAGIFGRQFSEQPIQTSSEHLLQVCSEFETLIDSPSVDESKVQNFLETGNHRYILRPDSINIDARQGIGGMRYIPDFTCHCSDGDFHFIEIEDPKRAIYQSTGGEQSAHLTHAVSQVQDWLRYISDNRDTVRREDGLTNVYKPTGEVIAGRDSHLNDIAKRRFDWSRSEASKISIRTYDMLLQDIRVLAKNLARFGGN
jgi:hypothetical protein